MSSKSPPFEPQQVEEEFPMPRDLNSGVEKQRTINPLGIDILILIFEQIQLFDCAKLDPPDVLPRSRKRWGKEAGKILASLRLVSRLWDSVAIPFVFRDMRIHRSLVDRGPHDRVSTLARQVVWGNMRAYTRHVILMSRHCLNWNGVIKLLSKCKYLDSISYIDRKRSRFDLNIFPKPLANVFKYKWKKVRLDIYEYRLGEPNYDTIPAANISYLELFVGPSAQQEGNAGLPTSQERQVRKFLVACCRLESLFLYFRSRGVFAENGGVLPAIRRLALHDSFCNHTSESVSRTWNFSKLEVLHFETVPEGLNSFLQSIDPESIQKLRIVKFKTGARYDLDDTVNHNLLADFITQLPQLEELKLDTCKPKTLVPALVRLGNTLRVLKLEDTHLERRRPRDCLTIEQLATIQISCPKMTHLDLDWAITEAHHYAIFPVLANFAVLRVSRICLRLINLGVTEARTLKQMYLDAMHSSSPDVSNASGKLSPSPLNYLRDDDDSESDRDWKLELEFLWPVSRQSQTAQMSP